jgi:hypothetical protein
MDYLHINVDTTFINAQRVNDIVMFTKTNQYKGQTLVFQSWQEPIDRNKIPLYKKLFRETEHINKIWFVQDDYKYEDWVKEYDFVTYVDFLAYQTYRYLSDHNKSWNHNATKFLCHTGTPHKFNRTVLIYNLYKEGLLDNCEYSYPAFSKEVQDSCRPLLPNLEHDEFYTWINAVCKEASVDNYSNGNPHNDWLWGLSPEQELVKNMLFNVTVETWFCEIQNTMPFLTEKTWKPIINCLPFIHVGEPGSLQKLKNLGYRTFEDYFVEQYDDITDPILRMNAIVKNIKHWHTNILDYKDSIKQDVEHNYNHFNNVMQTMIENVNAIDDIDILVDYTLESVLKNRPDLRLTS